MERGFTLTELAIVLLIAGSIIGLIWAAGAGAWENYRAHRTMQQVLTLVQNVRDYYVNAVQLPNNTCTTSTGSSMGGDITCVLDGLNLFPVEMRRCPEAGAVNSCGAGFSGGAGNTPIDHSFDNTAATGSLHVISELEGTAANRWFEVSLQNLSPTFCTKLLMQTPMVDSEIGIIRVGVGANSACVDASGIWETTGTTQGGSICAGGSGTISAPISPVTAAAWCTGASETMFWDFKLRS